MRVHGMPSASVPVAVTQAVVPINGFDDKTTVHFAPAPQLACCVTSQQVDNTFMTGRGVEVYVHVLPPVALHISIATPDVSALPMQVTGPPENVKCVPLTVPVAEGPLFGLPCGREYTVMAQAFCATHVKSGCTGCTPPPSAHEDVTL
jgi:hypothetical protein